MKPYYEFFKPLLKFIKESGNSVTTQEAYDGVSTIMKLTNDELEELTNDGQEPAYKNTIRWARRYLKDSDFLDEASRGIWKLSEKGIKYNLDEFNIKDVLPNSKKKETETEDANNKLIRTTKKKQEAYFTKEHSNISPTEKPEIDEDEDTSILDYLQNIDPYDFEILSKNILREYGFYNVSVTKRSGDNGIDGYGLVRINPFISISVAFQSKRYKGAVSNNTIRDFKGGFYNRAEKGVIITTGYFTKDAAEEANRDKSIRIELIDGIQLVQLMKEKKIGVKKHISFSIDEKYFNGIK